MGPYLFLAALVLIAGAISFFIAWLVRKQMVKKGNRNAKVIGIVTFIGSFLLLFVAFCVIVILSIPFER